MLTATPRLSTVILAPVITVTEEFPQDACTLFIILQVSSLKMSSCWVWGFVFGQQIYFFKFTGLSYSDLVRADAV